MLIILSLLSRSEVREASSVVVTTREDACQQVVPTQLQRTLKTNPSLLENESEYLAESLKALKHNK